MKEEIQPHLMQGEIILGIHIKQHKIFTDDNCMKNEIC